uniref:Uncharacterized protein n=1 Tax=Arsenophonus endosymbiont of Trialeurodes vaporariorum TaxID=235567 RepID=A0A3B0MMN5_9GAMM
MSKRLSFFIKKLVLLFSVIFMMLCSTELLVWITRNSSLMELVN